MTDGNKVVLQLSVFMDPNPLTQTVEQKSSQSGDASQRLQDENALLRSRCIKLEDKVVSLESSVNQAG